MKKARVCLGGLVFFVLLLPFSVNAMDGYGGGVEVSDIALTPGVDETQLNMAFYVENEINNLKVQVLEKKDRGYKNFRSDTLKEYPVHCSEGIDGYACKTVISGLKNSTEYLYRFRDEFGYATQSYKFTSQNSHHFEFVYLADSQIGASAGHDATDDEMIAAANEDAEGWANTVDVINENFPNLSFILSGGDQIEHPTYENEYTGFFSAEELVSLPLAPAIGSHDQAENFNYHFNLPNESKKYGVTEAGGDYSFSYGDVLFIVLNMDEQNIAYKETSEVDCSDHDAFIAETIAANQNAKWKVLMWHYSIYSSGMHAQDDVIVAIREAMVPIIDSYDIDVVFMAHDHTYCRTYQMFGNEVQNEQRFTRNGTSLLNPTGTMYLTGSSSSGSKYYSYYSDDPFYYSEVRSDLEVPTFSRIVVDRNTFSLQVYRTDSMDVIDTYSMTKTNSHGNDGYHKKMM